jgi:hypothetical protein
MLTGHWAKMWLALMIINHSGNGLGIESYVKGGMIMGHITIYKVDNLLDSCTRYVDTREDADDIKKEWLAEYAAEFDHTPEWQESHAKYIVVDKLVGKADIVKELNSHVITERYPTYNDYS